MIYTKRNIPAIKRNGDISSTIINNYYGSEGVSSQNSSSGGNYLPAIKKEDGFYHISLDKVIFDGVVEASQDVGITGVLNVVKGLNCIDNIKSVNGSLIANTLDIKGNASVGGNMSAKGEVTAYKANLASVATLDLPEENYNVDADPLAKINTIKVELSKVTKDSTLDEVKDVLIQLSKML